MKINVDENWTAQDKAMRNGQSEITDAAVEGKKEKQSSLFVCLQSFEFGYRSEWKVVQVLSEPGVVGLGQQSDRDRPE